MEKLEGAALTELRDELAVQRTHLANERTLLAYVRTALAMAGAGAGLIALWESGFALPIGVLLIVAGVALVPWGTRRYYQAKATFRK